MPTFRPAASWSVLDRRLLTTFPWRSRSMPAHVCIKLGMPEPASEAGEQECRVAHVLCRGCLPDHAPEGPQEPHRPSGRPQAGKKPATLLPTGAAPPASRAAGSLCSLLLTRYPPVPQRLEFLAPSVKTDEQKLGDMDMPQVKCNGIHIEIESIGRDDDPAVLLIMGYSGQLTMWPNSFCNGLAAKGFRVVRFDNRDVGKSTHLMDKGQPVIPELMAELMSGKQPQAPYSLNDMAADAVGFLDAIGIDRAHIVGASMGGMIAQLVAANHPAKAKSLVSIMSTTGRPGLPQAKPEAMAVLMTPPASTSREDRIRSYIDGFRVIGSPEYPATEAELRACAERDTDRVPYEPAGLARQLAAIIAAPPRNEVLKKVRAPTLVIHGADDPLIPVAAGKDTAESIGGAELVVIPGMAHDFTEAAVPVYLKHIGDFVSKVEARVRST